MTKFKITGPGEYRTRDGRKAVVDKCYDNVFDDVNYLWHGYVGSLRHAWDEFGNYWSGGGNDEDIIGPWVEQATVTTVLEYKGITKKPSAPVTWLEFVQIMQQLDSPASTSESSPKAEKQSEDEAEGNEACEESGDAVDALEHALYITAGVFAKDRKKASLWLLMNLQETGFSIVRTSTLGNRNGCYNTRTDKDVD